MVERWHLDNGREGKKKYRIMKRKLSSNGQQFHQYQSPITEHKRGGGEATPSDVGNTCHGLGQDKWIGSEKDALQQGTPMTTPNN
jgi:hypothetical protein